MSYNILSFQPKDPEAWSLALGLIISGSVHSLSATHIPLPVLTCPKGGLASGAQGLWFLSPPPPVSHQEMGLSEPETLCTGTVGGPVWGNWPIPSSTQPTLLPCLSPAQHLVTKSTGLPSWGSF